jgi:hypothetical protein
MLEFYQTIPNNTQAFSTGTALYMTMGRKKQRLHSDGIYLNNNIPVIK